MIQHSHAAELYLRTYTESEVSSEYAYPRNYSDQSATEITRYRRMYQQRATDEENKKNFSDRFVTQRTVLQTKTWLYFSWYFE